MPTPKRIVMWPLTKKPGLYHSVFHLTTPSQFVNIKAMKTLYTIGYSKKTPEKIEVIRAELDALLVDVRFRAGSRNPLWNKSALVRYFGDNYLHCRALGNVNYKSGPIKLSDPEVGAHKIIDILEHRNVILMCVCGSVLTCHRRTAADYIKSLCGCEIIHIGNTSQLAFSFPSD